MKEQIITALRALDPLDEGHWTGQGLARVDVVAKLAGLPDLTRKDITDVLPSFNRGNADSFDLRPQEEAQPADKRQSEPKTAAFIPITVEPELSGVPLLVSERDALQSELEGVQREISSLRAREVALTDSLDILNARIDRESPPLNPAQQIQAYQQRQKELTAQAQPSSKPTLSPLDAALSVNPKRQKQRPTYPVK